MLDLPRDLRLYGVITIGNVKPGKSMKEKMMYNATHKTNKPYQKMMEACDRALPEPYVFAMQMGSDVQNQSVWLTSSSSWKQWIKLGGKDNNFCIVESALA